MGDNTFPDRKDLMYRAKVACEQHTDSGWWPPELARFITMGTLCLPHRRTTEQLLWFPCQYGRTALMFAATNGLDVVVDKLVAAGAAVYHTDTVRLCLAAGTVP